LQKTTAQRVGYAEQRRSRAAAQRRRYTEQKIAKQKRRSVDDTPNKNTLRRTKQIAKKERRSVYATPNKRGAPYNI